MLKKLLFLVVGAFVGTFAYAQNTPQTATIIDDLSTYEGSDPFVFNKSDRKVYAYNNLGEYELFGVYEKVYTLKTEAAEGELDYIYSFATDNAKRNTYIKTDYVPKANSHAIATAYIGSRHVHDWCAIFGVGYHDGENGGWQNEFTFFSQSNAGRGAVQTRVLEGNVENHFCCPWGRKAQYELDAANGIGYVKTMDGTILDYVETQVKTADCVTPLYIFAMNKDVPGVEEIVDCQNPDMKFFGLKIYEGETLVRDYVPYMKNGEIGVMDNVNNVFWPAVAADENSTPLMAGVTPTYEGKIVRLADDDHAYKYTNGGWTDLGSMVLEELADETYKDMSTWLTNDDHMPIYADLVYEEGANYIDPYVGTGGFEPLMTQVELEKGAEYNFKFDYINYYGSDGWNDRQPRAVVWNGYDLNTSADFMFPDTDPEILCSHVLGHEISDDYVPVTMDFTAAKEKETLLVQFGFYNDGKNFGFEFTNLTVAKYIYPELYPEINPDDFVEIEPTRYDADGVGYAPIDGGSGYSANEGFGKVLDNDASTKFCGNQASAYFVIKAFEPVAVKEYSIVTGADSYTYGNRNPRGWTLEGSNDQQTWTMIDKVENYDLIEMRNREIFTFVPSYVPEETGEDTGAKAPSDEKYQYFRFTVTNTRDGGCQIGEFWINEQAHTWGSPTVTEPTCCKQGTSIAECTDCKALKTEWLPETNNHNWEDGCYADMADKIFVFDSYSKDNPHHVKCMRLWRDVAGFDNLAADSIAAGWTSPEFDDSEWDTMALPLTSDGGLGTVWTNDYNSYLMRFPFTLESAAEVEELVFQAFHDDTYWVYLNGTCILQVNDWSATPFYSDGNRFETWDYVSTSGEATLGNGRTANILDMSLDLLQDGKNVLCVLCQQNWGGAYFDCRLWGIGDIAVGISNVETEVVGNNAVYDLQGRKLTSKNLPKGIYIVNGKKTVIK